MGPWWSRTAPSRSRRRLGAAAWASWPGISRPLPSHHGHVTSWAVPPRLETTVPVPRHGAQGISPRRDGSSLAIGARGGRTRPRPMRGSGFADGRFAPSPDRARCTSATCAPRCSPGCSRARRARASWCASRTSTRARSRPEHEAGQLADLAALGLDWDGAGRPPVRAPRALRGGDRARWTPTACCTPATARGRRSARPHRRRTGRCRRAPTPGRAAS